MARAASFLNFPVDGRANAVETLVDVRIAEPKHGQSEARQVLVPFGVALHFFGLVVLGTIQLHNHLRAGTVEIHNVMAKLLLSTEGGRMRFQAIIPKMLFLSRHLPPQLLRQGFIFAVVIGDPRHMALQSLPPWGRWHLRSLRSK